MPREREVMEVDVLFVGAGPASLAGAYHLAKLIREHNAQVASGQKQGEKLEELTLAVIEKGREVGALGLSGAVMDPRGLRELIPDFKAKGAPLEAEVTDDAVMVFSEKSSMKLPFVPPALHNHGNYVVSLSKLVRWMAAQLDESEVMVIPEFSGQELLYEGDACVGVRTGDKGVDKHGNHKPNYEPGADLRAKVTVLGEGPRGSLTKAHVQRFQLERGRNPQAYETGVKEVWEVPEGRFPAGKVVHTLGYPTGNGALGGGWIYGMGNNLVSIGFCTGLDYADPNMDPHRMFQQYKLHPFLKKILEGGKMVQYGAKTIPVGGYFSVPLLVTDGAMIIGDSAGLVNGMRLKGIHLAIKSGMLAAEAIFQALLKKDFSKASLNHYHQLLEHSWVQEEMYSSRNFHQGFNQGFYFGVLRSGIQMYLGGRDLFGSRLKGHADHETLDKWSERYGNGAKPETMAFDNSYTFDKLTDVYNSGTNHEEDQPSHLLVHDTAICHNKCAVEYNNPCERFCPAAVYEMVEAADQPHKKALRVNASNCVHCKTCDIKDPFMNITWVPPEGGGGPNYTIL